LDKSFAHLSQCKKKLIMYFNRVVVFSIVSYRSLNFQYQEVLRYVWDSRLIYSPNVLFLVNLMISDLSSPVFYIGNGVSCNLGYQFCSFLIGSFNLSYQFICHLTQWGNWVCQLSYELKTEFIIICLCFLSIEGSRI